MQIIKSLKKEKFLTIKRAFDAGELIIYPTETCYGVGVDATNPLAVKKLLEYKRRPEGKAISVAVADIQMAEKYVELNDSARELYNKFLPGPYTIISRSRGEVIKDLESERGTLGIRVPDHLEMLELLKYLGRPMTATSANSAGKKTPYDWKDLETNLSQKQLRTIDVFVDGGRLPKNPSSTVIDTTRQDLQVLRAGKSMFPDKILDLQIKSSTEMQKVAFEFTQKYINKQTDKCSVILFNADLGAGKTQFTKGLAKGLGITELVKSPTYSLIAEYDIPGDKLQSTNLKTKVIDDNKITVGKSNIQNSKFQILNSKLIHFDAWRLESLNELEALGLSNYIKRGNVLSVEWAGGATEFFLSLAKYDYVDIYEITIDYLSDVDRRLIVRR